MFTFVNSLFSKPGSRPSNATAAAAPPPRAVTSVPKSKKTVAAALASLQSQHKLLIFYGSQTGTAEDLATRIANEVYARFGVEAAVADPEDYDMTDLTTAPAAQGGEGKTVIGFFMATYGEGEPTDNAVDFYEWFMDGHGKGEDDDVDDIGDEMVTEKLGAGINYIMFGLGNSTYEYYNSMGRRMARRLDSIGATRVGVVGEGDDDGSMEDNFLEWKPKIIEALGHFYGIKDMDGKASRGQPHVPLFNVLVESIPEKQIFHGEFSGDHKPRRFKNGPGGADPRQFAEVTTKKRIIHDVKNPLFSRIIDSKQLFNETFDETKLSSSDVIPPPPVNFIPTASHSIKIRRHCIHMEFDISNTGARYETGDHVGIYGSNSVASVMELARAAGLSDEILDSVVRLKANSANRLSTMAKVPFPNPCTVRTALTHYLAINSPVKQHQLELMAKYAADEAEKEAIYNLVDDRAAYVEKVEHCQKNLAETLRDFKSIQLPLDVLLCELLGPIVVRYYSISSSSKKEPTTVSITAVAVRYVLPQPPLMKPTLPSSVSYKEGLVTSFVYRLAENQSGFEAPAENADETYDTPNLATHVPIFIRSSSFRLPRDVSAPVIMIGPGTGVAPFRGFIRERMHLAATGAAKKPVGSTWLFYGCRHTDQDHLYKDEFGAYTRQVAAWRDAPDDDASKAFDLRITNAFSRVPGQPKVYVQDLVLRVGEEVYEVLDKKKGYLYVCGDAKNMAADVSTLLLKLAGQYGGKSEEDAKKWVKNLKSGGKYQEDVW